MIRNLKVLSVSLISLGFVTTLFLLIFTRKQLNEVLSVQTSRNYSDKQQIIREMTDLYKMHLNRTLKQQIPEAGGTPMRSLIVSTFRSGSSFFGGILEAVPGTFYHFEPLIPFSRRFRSPPDDQIAIDYITKLLNCDFSHVNRSHLEYNNTINYFKMNQRLWNYCQLFQTEEECRDPQFLDPFCKLFPFHSMKIVRMGLKSASKLLVDER